MLKTFEGKSLEELEIIRKAKTNKIDRELEFMARLDREIADRKRKENPFEIDLSAWADINKGKY